MTNQIFLRQARAEDAEEITRISVAAKASNGYDDAFIEACLEELTVTQETLAQAEFWVACEVGHEELVLGSVSLAVLGGLGEINTMYVAPGMQGRGIGRLLFTKAEELAFARGLKALGLDADPSAVPFYQRMGFRVTGEAPSGSIPGRMLPRMEKTLV